MMQVDYLKAVEAIVTTGSFRGAAEVLHKAQSAVSYSIRSLERELGFALFDRSGYRPILTPAGHVFYQKAQAVLAQLEELNLMGKGLAAGVEPMIHVVISTLCPLEHIILTLQDFAVQFPLTQLKLSVEHMNAPSEMIRHGQADLAVADLFDYSDSDVLEPWCKVELVPVAGGGHPLAKVRGSVTRAQLMSYTQILVSSRPSAFESPSAGIMGGANQWSVTDFETKKALILRSLGWGNMPVHLIEKELNEGLIRRLDYDLGIAGREMCLIRSNRRPSGPALTALWNMLVGCREQVIR